MSEDPDNWVDTAVHRAQELGKQDGSNASGWWIQEHLTKARDARFNADSTLAADEAGDDLSIPYADLSGQWADAPTPDTVCEYAFANGGWDYFPTHENEPDVLEEIRRKVLDAYEESFNDTSRGECLDACRNELAS